MECKLLMRTVVVFEEKRRVVVDPRRSTCTLAYRDKRVTSSLVSLPRLGALFLQLEARLTKHARRITTKL